MIVDRFVEEELRRIGIDREGDTDIYSNKYIRLIVGKTKLSFKSGH